MNRVFVDCFDCVFLAKYPSHAICPSGRVFSLHNSREVTGDSAEYKDVTGRTRRTKIHQMVAEAFVPNPRGKKDVGHIDGNKKNNHPSNLYWGHVSPANQRLKKEDVRVIHTLLTDGKSNGEIAGRFGVDKRTISSIRRGASWETLYQESYRNGLKPMSGHGTREGYLTDEQVKEIYSLLSIKKKSKDIAKNFNVARATISNVKTGKTHKQLYHLYKEGSTTKA